ncbi:MAG: hypothetical protein Q8Q95_00670 [bacterium]|nr:hypothetical protein [bacterium]
MAYSIKIKEKALSLRTRGYSISEIHNKLSVSKGRVSEWVRDVNLSDKSKLRLLNKVRLGVITSAKNKKARTQRIINSLLSKATDEVDTINVDNTNLLRLFCSLIYWCEGGKDHYSGVRFTNSDPQLVKVFLNLFRKSFKIDAEKFRICVHLHEYHNVNRQLNFWSNITDIPLKQFIKPFNKPNTGKRIKEGYNGCVSVRYHSVEVARQLLATAQAFFIKQGAVAIK